MKFLKVKYKDGCEYYPTDGRKRWRFCATENEDGSVKLDVYSTVWRYCDGKTHCANTTYDQAADTYEVIDGFDVCHRVGLSERGREPFLHGYGEHR